MVAYKKLGMIRRRGESKAAVRGIGERKKRCSKNWIFVEYDNLAWNSQTVSCRLAFLPCCTVKGREERPQKLVQVGLSVSTKPEHHEME